jgi:hypothetical protein
MSSNPVDYCPICGEKLPQPVSAHHCDPEKLRYIDAARKRDHDQSRRPTEDQRLSLGFELLDDDYGIDTPPRFDG